MLNSGQTSGKSFINNNNIEPCGTPVSTTLFEDNELIALRLQCRWHLVSQM